MADLTVTTASVLKSAAGNSTTGVAAVAIATGEVLYLTDAGTLNLADCDGTTPADTFVGIAQNSAAAGQPISYVTDDAAFVPGFTVLAGDPIYLSETPGKMTKTFADVTSGSKTILVGIMTSTTAMNLSPVVGGIKA